MKELKSKGIKVWIEPGGKIIRDKVNIFRLLHVDSRLLTEGEKTMLAEWIQRKSERIIKAPTYLENDSWQERRS